MHALRRLLAAVAPLLERGDPALLRQAYRRVVAPAGAALSHSGGLFALGQHGAIEQIGEVQQQVAVLRWLRPADGELASTFAERDVGEDVAALVTLATRRRIRTLPELTLQQEGAAATVFMPVADIADTELPSPMSVADLGRVEPLLWEILSIADEDEFAAVAQAVRLYHAAVLVIPAAPTAGYTLLTAALETLSAQAESPPATWEEWSGAAAWDKHLDKIGIAAHQADAIRTRLLSDSHLNLTRRFVAYVNRMVPDSFWTEPWNTWTAGIRLDRGIARLIEGVRNARQEDERTRHGQAQLPELLRSVYRARSGYVHEGKAVSGPLLLGFPQVQLAADALAPLAAAELPSLEFLERLARVVILEAIRTAGKDPTFQRPDLAISG